MDKVYFSIALFVLLAICFPVLQTATIDANLTNTTLDSIVVNMPIVILAIFGVLPIAMYFKEKNR